jgi:hypothetical protein
MQLPVTLAKKDVNLTMFHGFFLLHSMSIVSFRANIWLHKEEMVQLVNGLLQVNSTWGELERKLQNEHV